MQVLVVDLFSSVISVSERFTDCTVPLELPSTNSSPENAESPFLAEHMRTILEHYVNPSSLLTVIFGNKIDPFEQGPKSIHRVLSVLEVIASFSPQKLVLQTRSPFAMLAVPIFKALGSAMEICIALENEDDETARLMHPNLPRPSERLRTARSLKNIGVKTTIQYAPLEQQRRLVDPYGLLHLIRRCSDELTLVAPETVIKSSDRIRLIQNGDSTISLQASKRLYIELRSSVVEEECEEQESTLPQVAAA